MGNVLTQPAKLQPDLVTDVPNVVLKDTMGASWPFVHYAECCRLPNATDHAFLG